MSTSICDVGLGNTGQGCQPIAKIARKLIFVSYFKEDGTINSLDVTVDLTQVLFDGLINQADPFQRWFPTPNLDNVEDLRADPIFQTLTSGQNVFVQNGPRAFNGFILKESPEFQDKISKNGCTDLGAFVVDIDNNIIGNGFEAGKLKPIRIDQGTYVARLVKATNSEAQMVQIQFEWDQSERDEDLRMITIDDLATGVIPLSFKGLLDVFSTISAITTTTFTADLDECFGTQKKKNPITGLLIGDFVLKNLTTPATVVITTATEVSDGIYDFVIPLQGSADVMELDGSKTGLDFAKTKANTFAIL